MKSLFASCPLGLEELLKKELSEIGAQECKVTQGGVTYRADEPTIYKTLLWSRLASRILLPLSTFDIYSDLDLYSCVVNYDWSKVFDVDCSFLVHFSGTNEEIRNSQYGALKVKDAIVDHFMRIDERRPSVSKEQPDIRIHVYLNKQTVTVSLDLSGESLHQRGYRVNTGEAPIKENLAAAILSRSNWDQAHILLDPMCGSGTLLIEGAMMAKNMAPGLNRTHWGFFSWKQFNPTLWNTLTFEAKDQVKSIDFPIVGYDNDPRVIERAKINATNAGLSDVIEFQVKDVLELKNPYPDQIGTVISNPPYGERLESQPALIALYTILGQRLKHAFGGWNVSLFSASSSLLDCIGMRADRQFKAKNGPLDCLQKNYHILKRDREDQTASDVQPTAAQDFANRLKKNCQKLDKWAKQEGIECYRIYDADLPEYNVAIDRYQQRVVVQEYAPPKNIDEEKAKQRLYDIINQTLSVLRLRPNQLILKTRERQKGKKQYQSLAKTEEFFAVKEYQAKFLVNITDYLDTGLFLDHRLVRKYISTISRGTDFLNLFAYTGTASVYAGLGGAKTTTTVDMSRTYLEWAAKNLDENRLTGRNHRLIQADCLYYLEHCEEHFDLIFIDPPTFSNSKRMDDTFDVQRDHIQLLTHLKRLLRPQGTIIFSNNKRKFKMDYEAAEALGLEVKDITTQTIPLDFARNRSIHHCFIVQHKAI